VSLQIGTSTGKLLIITGIGRFTIADDAKIAEEDLGVNFFLDESCLGQSRAKCCMERLLELNPDVQGDYLPKQGVCIQPHEVYVIGANEVMVVAITRYEYHTVKLASLHHDCAYISASVNKSR
jgi:molybdopterin/thiamine biosynthesis adenylyltransferase